MAKTQTSQQQQAPQASAAGGRRGRRRCSAAGGPYNATTTLLRHQGPHRLAPQARTLQKKEFNYSMKDETRVDGRY